MPQISKDSLRERLRRGEFAPVYVLSGSEPFLRDIAVRTISKLAFSEGEMRDFNEDEFSLSTPENLISALSAAQQLPMMATRRVVRVSDVRIAATANRDTLKEDHFDALESYLADPSPSTILVLIADDLNGNRKTAKLLIKYATVVEFKPLDQAELVSWVRGKLEETKTKIDEGSLRRLISLVGHDLRRISTEVEKLITAAMPDNVVTSDHIDDLVPFTRELENFDLTDHLIAGRKQQAIESLKKILDDGAEPLALLGLISYNFRRLLIAKEMMANGTSREEVVRTMRLRYGDQEPFLLAARRSKREGLVRILERLNEVDLAIKTSLGGGGPAGSRMQIEMLVCETAMSG